MPAHAQDGVGWTGQLAYKLGHGPEGVALLAHRHRRTCWVGAHRFSPSRVGRGRWPLAVEGALHAEADRRDGQPQAQDRDQQCGDHAALPTVQRGYEQLIDSRRNASQQTLRYQAAWSKRCIRTIVTLGDTA
jgi:hypothetical protein